MARGRRGRRGRRSSSSYGMHEGSSSMAGGGQPSVEAARHGGSMAGGGQSSVEAARHGGSMAEGGQSRPMEVTRVGTVASVGGQSSMGITPGPTFADFNWPEEVVVRIIALLPLLSLLRYRVISPEWNAMVNAPFFRQLRESVQRMTILKEFAKSVTDKYSLKPWRLEFDRIAGGLLSMVKHEDVFVLAPMLLSVTHLPRLHCTAGIGQLQVLLVVGMLVNEATSELTVFAVTRVIRTIRRRDYYVTIGQGPSAQGLDVNMYCYSSLVNNWTACGRGMDLDSVWREIHSMTMHGGLYMALVKNRSVPYGPQVTHFFYDVYYFSQFNRWERLPGPFPEATPESRPEAMGVSIFDHDGALYLAKPSDNGCSLWKYSHDAFQWVLVRDFQNPIAVDVESELCWDETKPYSESVGDYLLFGAFEPLPRGMSPMYYADRRCRMLMFNLSTGMLTNMDKSDEQLKCFHVKRNLQKAQAEFYANGLIPYPY